MNISKLALIALLGSALMAIGCGDTAENPGGAGGGTAGTGGSGTAGTGGSGTGGTAGTAGTGGTGGVVPPAPATLFCPVEALEDETVAAIFPDGLSVPIDFVETSDLTEGVAGDIAVSATSEVGPLPATVTATVADTSTTQYTATAGGMGTFEVMVPGQELSGSTLEINAGMGSGEVTPDLEATTLTLKLTEAVFDITVTDPIELDLTLDATEDGLCEMQGDGLEVTVSPADE